MSKKKKTGLFKNKNGNMDIIEFLNLIDKGEIDNYKKYKRLSLHKCPPTELIPIGQQCFYCMECINGCLDRVKNQKTGYKVGRKRYKHDEMDELTDGIHIPDFKTDMENQLKNNTERGW